MKSIALVVFPGFQILDAAAISVFETANLIVSEKAYDLHIVSESGGPVASSMGGIVATQAIDMQHHDTLIVAGSMTIEPASPTLLALLAQATSCTRRIASICTGAFVLAEAGILDGRRATTHWYHARHLQHRFAKIRVEEDRIFVRDGAIWTSAGMTACIDLALALVEADLGNEVSQAVAKMLVVHHRRAGGQSQFSALSDLRAKSDRIQDALTYAKNHLKERLSVEQLADVVHLSPRHFSRAFRLNTGQSPARAVEKLRVETARLMVEAGKSIEYVAQETGFADTERMRRAFLRAFGAPPQSLKRAAKARNAVDVTIFSSFVGENG
jgi:transcriptional regulator GlxA family with amidase domain